MSTKAYETINVVAVNATINYSFRSHKMLLVFAVNRLNHPETACRKRLSTIKRLHQELKLTFKMRVFFKLFHTMIVIICPYNTLSTFFVNLLEYC